MTELQVGLLYNLASAISKSQENNNNVMLKSYYLMRCKDITRGYGLPDKYFSSKIRCPNCCIEWTKKTEIKVKTIKLTKRQKQRLKSKKTSLNKKQNIQCRKDLPFSNEIEQICNFCKKSTITPFLKPQKIVLEPSTQTEKVAPIGVMTPKIVPKVDTKNIKSKVKKTQVNVYANALDVFSLQNKNNTLTSLLKEKPKPINNNKKKKDKFAGLCEKAVLASAKLKERKNKQNKCLNLFLKPSST